MIKAINRYRDGVKCIGGTGTVIIEYEDGMKMNLNDKNIQDTDKESLIIDILSRLQRMQWEQIECSRILKELNN